MQIHVRLWTGCRQVRITAMSNAGKRGKKCRTLSYLGTEEPLRLPSPESSLAWEHSERIYQALASLDCETTSFDDAVALVTDLVEQARLAGVSETWLRFFQNEVRGIDAPKLELTAGIPGKWSGTASEDGIRLHDLADPYNEWTEVTHPRQTNARAYEIAARVWPQVQTARSVHEAACVLREAGADLHGFCAVD